MKNVTREELAELFRDNLRALREDAGLSQSELARRMQTFPGVVCDLERGRRVPTFGTLAALADGLGVTPAALLSTVRSRHKGKRPSISA
jgi:transcriptional regulator with XRE-family HTH domain